MSKYKCLDVFSLPPQAASLLSEEERVRLVDAHIKVSGEYISHAMLGGLYRGLIYASHLPVRLPCCIDGPFAPNSLSYKAPLSFLEELCVICVLLVFMVRAP